MGALSPLAASDLSGTRIADGLTSQQTCVLTAMVECRTFEDGEAILDDAEESNDLFVLIDGRAMVRGTFNQEVNVIEPGSLIGELSFLDGKPRSASVLCDGRCRCAILSRKTLGKLKESHPDILAAVITNVALAISEKLRSAVRMINALSTNY